MFFSRDMTKHTIFSFYIPCLVTSLLSFDQISGKVKNEKGMCQSMKKLCIRAYM